MRSERINLWKRKQNDADLRNRAADSRPEKQTAEQIRRQQRKAEQSKFKIYDWCDEKEINECTWVYKDLHGRVSQMSTIYVHTDDYMEYSI